MAVGPLFAAARRRAVELLALQPGERLLIPGVGTGLDLPYLLPGLYVTAVDLSPAMLSRARSRAKGRYVTYRVMDAQGMDLPDRKFDAVLLNLVLSVVPDGAKAFREAWRVLRPGGRAVIFDKFLPETMRLSPGRRAFGRLMMALGTDPNRRVSEILGDIPDLEVKRNEPTLLNGQYRMIVLQKQSQLPSSKPLDLA